MKGTNKKWLQASNTLENVRAMFVFGKDKIRKMDLENEPN